MFFLPPKKIVSAIRASSLFVILCGFLFRAYPQINQVNFTQLLSENGLSQNSVHQIIQDSKGFMWFATEDGLDRYDGYNFTVYKNNPEDSSTISDNFIWTVYEDKNGNLWVGTNSGGICKFDRSLEKFTTYKNNPNNNNSLIFNNVRAIFEDNNGFLWIGTENGLDKFNVKEGRFTHYRHDPNNPHSLSNNVVLAIYEDRSDDLWVGSDGGLDMYDYKHNRFINYSHKPNNPNSLSNNIVLSIYQDYEGTIWVGTLNGLNRLNKKGKIFRRYLMNAPAFKRTISNRINSIIEDRSKKLWLGTGEGIYFLDRSTDKFKWLHTELSRSGFINNNNIFSLFEGSSGLIWIGTAEEGVLKFNQEKIKFKNYKHDPFDNNSLSYNTIRAIYQEKNGTLWVGTLGGGLEKLLPNEEKFIHYKSEPDKTKSLSDNSISAIYKDGRGYLWVGTWGGGLNRSITPISSRANKNISFIHYSNNSSGRNYLNNNIVQAIYEDSDGQLWIGTGGGLDLYDRKKNRFIVFQNRPDDPGSLSSDQVQSCLLEDRDGNLWIGTWDGLNRLDSELRKNATSNPSAVKFKKFRNDPKNKNSLSDNRVISGYKDSRGNLWFGTYGGGLNELLSDQKDAANPVFITYRQEQGLASNVIYCILQDNSGNLWLSTDNGLSMFNPVKEIFKNFDVMDGLQSNQFFWGAGFKGINGELFFGGTSGFNAFYPSELTNNDHIPPVVITDFKILNQPVEIGAKGSPLSKAISLTKKIELTYNQNVFSFEFSALDYSAPNKNRYAYKMEGFDKDWIYSGNRRFVTYTNLDPGKYTFKVIGSNNDGIWNKTGTQLAIIISPPFWRTWWFILSAVVTIGGMIYLIIYYRIKNLIGIERLRAKLAADLHDNIGSSLTEISILSEVISHKIDSADDITKKSLKMISDNSRNLIDSMSDIVWLVNPKRDSLYDLILRLRDTYSELSSYTNISFRSENIKELEKISLSMEHRQHLYLIFKEAINNSITHSKCSQITLDASVKGRRLEMTLKDDGIGFEESLQSSGNGLNNMRGRAKAIDGVLSILSEKGKGTTIQFNGNII